MTTKHALVAALALALAAIHLVACVAEPDSASQEHDLSRLTYFNCYDDGCVPARTIDRRAPMHAICDRSLCTLRDRAGRESDLFHDEIAALTAAQLRVWDAQLAAAGGGEYPWGGQWDQPTILDPYCAYFDFYGEVCPDNGGGGSSNPNPNPNPSDCGPHQGDLQCTLCSAAFLACVSKCPGGLFGVVCFGGCAVNYVKCARKQCDC
jgi:hypothetical protein